MDDLKEFLEEKYQKYNVPGFIPLDPVVIPHEFTNPEDIAISGFLASIIAWGQRPVILRNADILLNLMEREPYNFLREAGENDFQKFLGFVHRTFSGKDAIFFMRRLSHLYKEGETLESLFMPESDEDNMGHAIDRAREKFLGKDGAAHARHFASPQGGSAAKRINMFLRWMVRKDNAGVDFGIWKNHSPSLLICPLDVHSGNTARKLGLLKRKQNDWKAAVELTGNLRKFDPEDPVKYDFALFGLGVFEKF